MKICGIVAEFNPLHNGHKYLIDQVREQLRPDFLIVVMSGNFVQRGEFASFDKWNRTQVALEMGVDLIVELPFQYAVASADIFAQGAIEILNSLGCTDLVFGTEDPNFDYEQAANEILKHETSGNFDDYSQSYANQINDFYSQLGIKVTNPNQMLGLNYVLQIKKHNFAITPTAIKRVEVAHDAKQVSNNFASASQLRMKLANNESIEQFVPAISGNYIPSDYFKLLKYQITASSLEELAEIYQMNEGLENKIKQEISNADSQEELLEKIKSKRYTYARLRRLLLYIVLNVKKSDVRNAKNFIHILGFNQQGQSWLNQINHDSQLPIITKVGKNDGLKNGIMALQIKVDEIYSLFSKTDQNFKRKPEMK